MTTLLANAAVNYSREVMKKRFRALVKETWWLWTALLGGSTILSLFSKVFLLSFPICAFVFFWFAYVRYDEDGNFKGT